MTGNEKASQSEASLFIFKYGEKSSVNMYIVPFVFVWYHCFYLLFKEKMLRTEK